MNCEEPYLARGLIAIFRIVHADSQRVSVPCQVCGPARRIETNSPFRELTKQTGPSDLIHSLFVDLVRACGEREGGEERKTQGAQQDEGEEMHEMDSLKDLSARSTSPPSHQRQQDRFRMLRPLLAACFVFAAAMLLSRTLGPAVGGRLTASPSSERDSTLTVRQTNEPEFYTTDCASPQTAAVAQGVDLVAYFSLQTWEPAVAGKTEYASTYQAYRFLFSSAEHKTMFEVSIERATSLRNARLGRMGKRV